MSKYQLQGGPRDGEIVEELPDDYVAGGSNGDLIMAVYEEPGP